MGLVGLAELARAAVGVPVLGLLEALADWAQQTLGPYGVLGLIVLAVTEAIFSPVPPDVLLPILVKGRSLAYAGTLGVITTVASVAGGAVGYWIGDRFSPWVHENFSSQRLAQVELWYRQYGEWVVAVAAFTPIPFKVFTVASGLLGLRFWPFILASLIGRGARFIPEALLAAVYGEAVLEWTSRYELELAILAVVVLVGLYLWTRQRGTDPTPES